MPSVDEIKANASLIRGFLKPIFFDELGRPGETTALDHADFCKVRDGYACSRCLCEYTTYLVKCPVCGHERDLARDLQAPDPLHVEHLTERATTEGMDVGGIPRSFDEFMRGLEQSKDVDHIDLAKLGPSKKGRK
jgi:hypothetical protein